MDHTTFEVTRKSSVLGKALVQAEREEIMASDLLFWGGHTLRLCDEPQVEQHFLSCSVLRQTTHSSSPLEPPICGLPPAMEWQPKEWSGWTDNLLVIC
eukprot:3239667-Amphidinium_carterae.1